VTKLPSRERSGRDASATVSRILDAAARCIVESGAVSLSMSEVATAAGVSKALIHYHFHDKDTLLVRLLERTVNEIVGREQRALAGQATPLALNAVWDWLEGELKRGSLRVLLEVSQVRTAPVEAAARAAAAQRRRSAADSVRRLFVILELTPRVPAELLAEVIVAFVDGLAIDSAHVDERAPRVAFDVFWLALLNLAE
jgi:AcrR family transcriptional regulator